MTAPSNATADTQNVASSHRGVELMTGQPASVNR